MRSITVFIILSLLLLTNSNISSQIRISGVVADENGDRLESASVQELKTYNGALTDSTGRFFLIVSAKSLIRISYIGYADTIFKASEFFNDTIFLKPTQLKDVYVVAGYLNTFSIGYFGDYYFMPIGISISYFVPYYNRKSIMLSADASYKTNFKSNSDFSLQLTRINAIKYPKYSLDLSAYYDYRNLEIGDINYKISDVAIELKNSLFNQVSLSLGILFRNEQYIKASRQWGYIMGSEKYFYGINQRWAANVLLVGNNVEYGVSFYQGFPISKWSWKSCIVGLEYNKYKEYNELNIALKYIVKYN